MTIASFNAKNYRKYFNSHAHVERDFKKIVASKISEISTHTLTWSVTSSNVALSIIIGISTHTLTWSVTDEITKKIK